MNHDFEKLRFESVIGDTKTSFLKKYQDMMIGERNFFSLIKYELCTFLEICKARII